MSASQRSLVSLGKKVTEKVENIRDQRHLLSAILDEYIADSERDAESLLAITDKGMFMQSFVDVMQNLDRCYNTCFLLTTEAENLIEEAQRASPTLCLPVLDSNKLAKHTCGEDSLLTVDLPAASVNKQDAVRTESCRSCLQDRGGPPPSGMDQPTVLNVNLNENASKPAAQKHVWNIKPDDDTKESCSELKHSSPTDVHKISDCSAIPNTARPRLDMNVAKRCLRTVIKQAESDNGERKHRKTRRVRTDSKGKQKIKESESAVTGEIENVLVDTRGSIKAEHDLQNFAKGNTASKDCKDICPSTRSKTSSSQNIDLSSENNNCSSENISMSTQNANVPPQNFNVSAHNAKENLLNVEDFLNKLDKPNASENTKLVTSEIKTEEVYDARNDCDSNVNAYVSLPTTTSSVDKSSAVSPQTSHSFDTVLTPKQNLCQATFEEGLPYGLGPTLAHAELCVGQPVTVEVLEPTSPWKFYIQQVGFGLDKLMEQIFSYMIKHGEDKNLIKKPEKNMTCLAKFSQDGLYYRARVMQVYPTQDTEVPVDILYVDYGNREEGTSAHLRELPERFTSLPIQAIQCALAKVAPVNKYNVWTEDDISAFTQFVYSQNFSCVYVGGTEEGLPQLIELYLYVPRPTVTGGQLYIHNTVSTVNIATVLVNQGRARDTAIIDQIEALRRMYKPSVSTSQPLPGKITVKQMSDKGRVPQQSNTATSSGQTSLLTEKGKIPRPMKLPRPKVAAHKNKVMSVKSIVAAASGVTPESGTQDTMEKVKQGGFVQIESATQHKVTSGGGSHHKVGPNTGIVLHDTGPAVLQPREADTGHSKHDGCDQRQEEDKQNIAVLPSQEQVSSDVAQPNQKEDSTNVKKASEDDQNSEEDRGNIFTTPTPQSSVPDNSSTSTTANETQSIADFLANLPLANIKIPNILQSDEQLSVISSEGCSVPAANQGETTSENSSYRNIDLCSKCFNVMLSHAVSPEHFYIHIVSETVGKTLDNMMKNLNYHFEQIGRKNLQQLNRSYTPDLDDLCCARFSGDNFFYRAVVTEVVASESSSSASKVHVFYLDFGDREWVPRWKLFPLPEEFKDTPPLALSCSLAYIKPVVTSQDSDALWPANVTQEFIKQVGFENPIQMIVLSGTLCFDMKRKPACGMVDSGILKVFLVGSEDEEEVCVNMDLIRLGLATIDSRYSQEIGLPNAPGDVELGDWDPMAEDYLSIRNSYNIDVDDPGVATVQYKAQDEKQICKYFSNNSCWRGDRCPYRHVQVTGGVTMDREPVYGGLDEAQIEALLPECDTCVAIEIATILNPAHFYIILPWGKRTLDSLLDPSATDPGEDEETLDELVNSLQSHYGNMSFSQKTLVHYAEGELVVARFVQDGRWYRAKVLRSDDRERDTKIQVFYVDFGNKEWVSERDIKSMEPQFLHLPFQAIECFLVDIEPVGHSDQFSQKAKKMFQQMTDGKTLVAYVKSRSWSGCLYIDLFDTSSEEDINIGKVLIAQGLAQVPRPHSETSLTSRSGSEGSLLLIPG
ncbi:uncharacterized protein LOC110461698 [Mizuhopecten yessoensis]|uniref:Tudor and KH domain-containing protein n=1 Tax=Mizuhopecten yessoensis TaxID=6573 RepID=A0A210PZP4_MIZYE|nr:uncharacterized protein LOC110461698 [Mizuhopecten yessoensis]OWF41971.1 Tudor and KH domain-containing protein [Mizuhopecten yessoensis]